MERNDKKKGGLYMYAVKKNGGMFIERGAYRLHLCGKFSPTENMDRYLFKAAKELGLTDFKTQFAKVLSHCADNEYPVFSLYVKDDKII